MAVVFTNELAKPSKLPGEYMTLDDLRHDETTSFASPDLDEDMKIDFMAVTRGVALGS